MNGFLNRWVWRQWATRFLPREGWVYDQNNGVVVTIPLIVYEAWLRDRRANYSSENILDRPIGRMSLGHVRDVGGWSGGYGHPVPYLLFTNRSEYDALGTKDIAAKSRELPGKVGNYQEFQVFCRHFLVEKGNIEIPSPFDNRNPSGRALLGELEKPEDIRGVIEYVRTVTLPNQWRALLK